jgi:hypothetical protein
MVGRGAEVVGLESGRGMPPIADSFAVRCDGAIVVTGTGASSPVVSTGDPMRGFSIVLLSIGQGFLGLEGALIFSHAIG